MAVFSHKEERIVARIAELYGVKHTPEEWRSLLDEWHWWASNWRKYRGYFLEKVVVLGFDAFLEHYDIAERGRPIYEKAKRRRRSASCMAARTHN